MIDFFCDGGTPWLKINDFPEKDRELFGVLKHWSIAKYQIPSTKLGLLPEGGDSEEEITNKSQIPILNDQNRFGPPQADW